MNLFSKFFSKIISYFKREPKTFINENIIIKKIHGLKFIFDNESLKEYEVFSDEYHTIVIKEGYLARKQKAKNGYLTFFHIWLMAREIEKFKEDNNYYGKVEIHHEHGKNDNRKNALRCMRQIDHQRIIHNRQ